MVNDSSLTRRRLLTGGMAFGALTLLAACGGTTATTAPATTAPSAAPSAAPSVAPSTAASAAPTASTTAAASTAPSAASATRTAASGTTSASTAPASTATRATGAASPSAAAATGPRTITTFNGQITVPAAPQRIVSIDFYSPLTLLDLGVTPLGVINYAQTSLDLIRPQYRPILAAATKIGTNAETTVEAVATLKPDLIIGWSNNVKTYDQLRAIAPTAIFEYSNTNWNTFARSVAEAAGLTAPFNALVGQYESRAAGIKQTYAAQLGRTRLAIVSAGGTTNWILPNPNSTNALGAISLAGGQLVPSQASLTAPGQLSFEQINLLTDADAILYPATPEGVAAASITALLEQPLFKTLKATQAGRVYPLSYFNSGNYSGALGALDSFEAALKKL